MKRISAVYKITNKITCDCYVGSSKNVMHRWAQHKCSSTWKNYPNNKMYQDMKQYGVEQFSFEIVVPAAPTHLKICEQEFINIYKPAYNDRRSKGLDVERYKETYRESAKKYNHSEKGKESVRKYQSQLCSYNGETLTLNALSQRFHITGVEHPFVEAKKYLLIEEKLK